MVLGLVLGLLVLIFDFLSKWWVAKNLPLIGTVSTQYPYGGVPVFENFLGIQFSIVHATNKGAAWGAFADFQTPLLIFRIFLVIGLLIYLFRYNTVKAYVLPFCLIVAGAIGNIFDTFFYGQVIDMIKLTFWGYHYPVFNIADIAITGGIAWLILLSFLTKPQNGSI